MTFIFLAASAVLTAFFLPVTRSLARYLKLERPNFRGEVIPAGFGLLLVLVGSPVYLWMLLQGGRGSRPAIFLACIVGFGLLGLIDDVFGNRDAGGFRGHLSLLVHGKISTGLVKAVGGGLLALALGYYLSGYRIGEGLLDGFVIGLSANFLNLLDLRPGRAVSCFWVGLLIVIFSTMKSFPVGRELVPLVIPAACLTVLDRSALVMMGDAGSNVLGAVLGVSIAYGANIPFRVGFLLFIIAVNLYSEKRSISKLIESNRALKRIDSLLGVR